MKSTKLMWTGLVACLCAGSSALAQCPVPDDVGDDPGTCATLPANNYNQQHSIDAADRADVDMFSFVSIPGATYSFTIEEITVDALDVCLRASDGIYILDRKNTAGNGTATITFSWSNANIGGLFYLDVRSLGEAVTGTYRFRMNTTLPTDKDNDLLPDSWEVSYGLNDNGFTGATSPDGTYHDKDGDGFTNFQELLMGTDPDDARSGLIVNFIEKDNIQAEVTFPVVQFGTYELEYFTINDDGPAWDINTNWTPLQHFTHMGASGNLTTVESDGAPPTYKIFRLRQFGIPHQDCEP